MRVLVLGGTRFLGRRIVERLVARGDEVLVVHRGPDHPAPHERGPHERGPHGVEPGPGAVRHLHTDRRELTAHAGVVAGFGPEAVVDCWALTGADVDAVLPVLPEVPAVVLSSQDVYQAFAALRAGRCDAAVPITEDAEPRRERYPYRGAGIPDIPDDYEKLDVEQRWLARGAVVLRLPVVYGPRDPQRREDVVLRRLRAGRTRIPIGAATLLWTRAHSDDLATGVLAALDTRAADGRAVNLGEPAVWPLRCWFQQIIDTAGAELGTGAELVTVPDRVLPPDLALTGSPTQHLVVSVDRAQRLLGWAPGDPAQRVADSVRWHLAHPPDGPAWTEWDTAADDGALAAATG